MSGSYYHDKKLHDLFAALAPDQRRKAFKGAMREMGKKTKDAVVSNLRNDLNPKNKKDALKKGVRALIYKKILGFRVTVGTANRKGKKYGYHVNRYGFRRPILMWAELGTAKRTVRHLTTWNTSKKGKLRKVRIRANIGGKGAERYVTLGRSRGAMPKKGFMGKTLSQVKPSVTAEIQKMIVQKVHEIAKKYGCK